MSNDWKSLCDKISKHPDNHLISELTDLLNRDLDVNYDEIFERCGKYLSGINLDDCLNILLKKGDQELIEKYLRLIEDLTEKQFIQTLNFSLKYLNILLDKRYDYWSLTNALKLYLNSSTSVDLAEELARMLMESNHRTETILDWFCALIDAHYSAFVLAKWNKIPLLEKYLQDRLNTFDLLEQIQPMKKISSSSSSSSSSNTKVVKDNLYTLQRIHFK